MSESTGSVKSGEAGHSGRDRQPGKGNPPGEDHAQSHPTPEQVKSRSNEAGAGLKNQGHDKSDMIHPGPNREEAQRSKGDAHHDQHEKEKEMKHEEL